jgi:hypothetical protein
MLPMTEAESGRATAEPQAQAADSLLREAESAFALGAEMRATPLAARSHFHKAAGCYEALHERGIHNAALCLNEGNACLLAGDLPAAIMNYRRGVRLAPFDTALRANLAFARSQVAYSDSDSFGRPPEDWTLQWPRLPGTAALLLFAGFYSCAFLAATRWYIARQPAHLWIAVAAGAIAAVFAGSLVFDDWSERQESAHPLATIAEDGVLLRKGNGFSYPPRYQTPLNRGVEARLLTDRGPWIQIQLGGGEIGWIPRASALID